MITIRKNKKAGWKAIVFLGLAILVFVASFPVSAAQSQDGWRGEYYNNMTLSGSPALVRTDKTINFDWGTGSPEGGIVSNDQFSVRWTGNLDVSGGRYTFNVAADDGVRLWVNGQLLIDKWQEQQGQNHAVDVDLPSGNSTVQMEYYENLGGAKAMLSYARKGGSGSGSGPWKGAYYDNKNLSGSPVLNRNDDAINFKWGPGSPKSGTIPNDKFSVRWTRDIFVNPGRYQFVVTSDDGVRLWVNNQLIIDQWHDQNPATYRAEIDLHGTSAPVKLEYFENTGGAQVQLSWTNIGAGGGNYVPGNWRAEYFNNTTLSGVPALVRDEGQPNYTWGWGSPSPVINANYFSARWTRTLDLTPGRYRFTATTDDGVRLWVNNRLIIDDWRDHAVQSISGEIDLAGGSIPINMEYYEGTTLATAILQWSRIGDAANTGGAPMAAVTSSRLNVRQGPGVSHPIMAVLARGELVRLAGIRNSDATWVKVILPDGWQGWSYAGFLQSSVPFSSFVVESGQPTPVVNLPTGNTATVTAFNLNVRQGPGVSYPVITVSPRNTVVSLLGRNAAATWAKVSLPSGTQGWVNASYLNSNMPISTLPTLG